MAPRASVTIEPALERWNQMREDVYKHFKWTKYTARTAIISMIVIPGLCTYIFAQQKNKYNWRGKRKGEPLASK